MFRLHHPRIADPRHGTGPLSAIFLAQRFISYEYAKRLVSDVPPSYTTWLRHGMNAATDSPSTVRFLFHWLKARTLADRKFPSVIIRPRTNLFSLDFHAEQVPNPDSRIMLGSGLDRFGNRQIRVDWRYTAQDVETVAKSFDLLSKELAPTNRSASLRLQQMSVTSRQLSAATVPMAAIISARREWAPAHAPALSTATERCLASTIFTSPAARSSRRPARRIRR